MAKNEFADKYWICSACAKKRKWKLPVGAYTVISGRCSYCKTGVSEILTPIVDFKRPGKPNPVWD